MQRVSDAAATGLGLPGPSVEPVGDASAAASGERPELVVDGRVATITLRRPAVANRLVPADLLVLREHLRSVDAAPGVLVLRLAAQGRHFCSGFDIGQIGQAGIKAGTLFEAFADKLERRDARGNRTGEDPAFRHSPPAR